MSKTNEPPPEVEEGGVPEPPGDAADNTSEDQAAITEPVDDDLNPIPAAEHQPDSPDGPAQPVLPGMEDLDPGDLAAWEAASDDFFDQAEATGAVFSAVDHRDVVGMPPANVNRIGLAFGQASRSGRFEEVGAVRSPVSSRRAGLVRLWCARRAT